MKYESVIQHITHGIQIGLYPDRSNIPSEKHLAEELNVSVTSVREGLRQLCERNIIIKQQGKRSKINAAALQDTRRTLHFVWIGRSLLEQSTPVQYEIYSKVFSIFMQLNCHISFLPYQTGRDEALILRMFDSFDGFILASIQPHLLGEELQERLRSLNTVIEVDDIGTSPARWKVCTDNYRCGLIISDYLAEQKRRRPVLFLSDFADAYPGFNARNRGLIDGLAAHRIPFVLVPGGETSRQSEDFKNQIADLLKKHPDIDTIWHPFDVEAIAIRKVFEEVMPREEGFYRSCGVDGLPEKLENEPFHASAAHDIDEQARICVETMLNIFSGKMPDSCRQLIPPTLIPWETIDPIQQ